MSYAGRITIGVYIDAPEAFFFHKEILRGIHEEASENNINIITFAVENFTYSDQPDSKGILFYECLNAGFLDGAIFITPTLPHHGEKNEKLIALLQSTIKIPVVTVYDIIEGFPAFIVDNSKGFSSLLDHLFHHHKYKVPLYVSGPHNTLDSIERQKIYKQSLAKYGLAFNESDVFYSTYHFNDGVMAIDKFLDQDKKKPDVIICANDSTALGVQYALLKRGLLVPEDIAISGFDDIKISDWTGISLTTVRNPINEIGCRSVQSLIKKINQGVEIPIISTLDTNLVIRGSCGCTQEKIEHPSFNSDELLDSSGDKNRLKMERLIRQEGTLHNYAELEMNRHLNWIADGLIHDLIVDKSIESDTALYSTLIHTINVENFILSLFGGQDDPIDSGLCMKVAYKNGVRMNLPREGIFIQTPELMPLDLFSEKRFSLIAQVLYTEDKYYGIMLIDYGAQGDNVYELLRRRFSVAMESIYISKYQKALNKELTLAKEEHEALSMTDELTGLNNRRGFMILGNQMCQLCRRHGHEFVIIFIDLDGLKKINDQYGHDEGDVAIKVFSNIMKEAFRGTDIIARYGGDEYTALAENITKANCDELLARLQKKVDEVNRDYIKSWTLSYSLGIFYSTPGCPFSLEKMISIADSELYKAKEEKKRFQIV